jgi:undecaprenyl-diphosphatase
MLAFTLLAGYAAFVPIQPLDRTLLDAVIGLQSPLLDPLIDAVHFLGETWPAIILPGLTAIWLWVKGFRQLALWLVAALLAESLASVILKAIIDRMRPDGGHFSFISGHTAYFTVFSGYLYVTLKQVIADRRWLIAWRVALVSLVVLTGISRMYLGVHWPTDVLGGFLLGVLVLVPVLWRVDNAARVTA